MKICRKNRSSIYTSVLFFSVCSTVWSSTPAQIIKGVEIPADATIQLVSADSIVNNHKLAMATISSSSSVESVLMFYRNAWQIEDASDAPGYIESSMPGWRLISKMDGHNNIVVQLNDAASASTTGFLSVMTTDTQFPSVPQGVFSDLTPLSSNRSVVGTDTSLMRVYGSNAPIAATHRNYRARLIRKGWKVMLDTNVEANHMLVLSRGSSRMEISFVESSSFVSSVVVHEVTSG